jgi:hypothetical protein
VSCRPCETARLGKLRTTKYPPFGGDGSGADLGFLSEYGTAWPWIAVGVFAATGAAAGAMSSKKRRKARAVVGGLGFGLIGLALTRITESDISVKDKLLAGGGAAAGAGALYYLGRLR